MSEERNIIDCPREVKWTKRISERPAFRRERSLCYECGGPGTKPNLCSSASYLGNDGIFPKSEENEVGSFVELKLFA
jgi:hypothetical protein